MIKKVVVETGGNKKTMFKTHTNGRATVYEYRLHAFTTSKGTFTLVGTETRGTETIDTFKNLDTGEFREYPRQSIKKWLDQGKIKPVEEATTLMWLGTNGNGTTIESNTKMEYRYHKRKRAP